MNSQRQRETGCLVPALALHPLDSVDATDDGLDTLFKRRDVRILRQALQRVGEVDGGVLERHLGKGTPAEPPGLVGQISCSIGAELLQGVEDALEEQG